MRFTMEGFHEVTEFLKALEGVGGRTFEVLDDIVAEVVDHPDVIGQVLTLGTTAQSYFESEIDWGARSLEVRVRERSRQPTSLEELFNPPTVDIREVLPQTALTTSPLEPEEQGSPLETSTTENPVTQHEPSGEDLADIAQEATVELLADSLAESLAAEVKEARKESPR